MNMLVVVKCHDGRILFASVDEHGLYWCEETGQLIGDVEMTAQLGPSTLH